MALPLYCNWFVSSKEELFALLHTVVLSKIKHILKRLNLPKHHPGGSESTYAMQANLAAAEIEYANKKDVLLRTLREVLKGCNGSLPAQVS